MMPAAISPTTCGWWRSLRKMIPTRRAATSTVPICRMRSRRLNFTASSSRGGGGRLLTGAEVKGGTARAATPLEGPHDLGLVAALLEAGVERERLVAASGALRIAAAGDVLVLDLDV